MMAVQALLGRLFSNHYRDADWRSIAGVQGALYLLVLTVNASLSMELGDTAVPGEIPIWGTLTLVTALATGLLLHTVRGGTGSP